MSPRTELALLTFGAALGLGACGTTMFDRVASAVDVRDWPKAESELWTFTRGPDCYGPWAPTFECKMAYVWLGEVLLADDRPIMAVGTLQMGRDFLQGMKFADTAKDQYIDRRMNDAFAGAKRRWDQFRAGVAGQCRIVIRYSGPGGRYKLESLWTALDLEERKRVATVVEGTPLVDSTTEAGLHVITIHAMYADAARPSRDRHLEHTVVRSCANGDQVDVFFQVRDTGQRPFVVNTVITGATGPEPLSEGPLRPDTLKW